MKSGCSSSLKGPGASPAGDSALTVNEKGAAGMDESLLQLQTEAAIPPPMAATDPAKAAAAFGRGILRSFRPLELLDEVDSLLAERADFSNMRLEQLAMASPFPLVLNPFAFFEVVL